MDVQQLTAAPVFLHISQERIQRFLELTPHSVKTYQPQDPLVTQGDPCRSLYLLSQGSVRTSMVGPDGKQVVLEDLHAPVLLAPAFTFSTTGRFPVNVDALTPCELLLISREHFLELLRAEPIVLQNFLRIISDRSHQLSQMFANFALRGLKSRVAVYLHQHGGITNQQEVADRLGVARPSLSRVIAELVAEGCISIVKRKVVITNPQLLQQYL